MLEQDQPLATVLARTATGWSFDLLRPGQTLAMPEIDAEIPIDDLYETLTFLPLPPPGEPIPSQPHLHPTGPPLRTHPAP